MHQTLLFCFQFYVFVVDITKGPHQCLDKQQWQMKEIKTVGLILSPADQKTMELNIWHLTVFLNQV